MTQAFFLGLVLSHAKGHPDPCTLVAMASMTPDVEVKLRSHASTYQAFE